MDKNEILTALDAWNFWNRRPDTGLPRTLYLKKLQKFLLLPEIIALTGIRRSGKSTILLQVIKKLLTSGVPKENILLINFEEPLFAADLSLSFLQETFDAYKEFFNPRGKIYLFLDEVHLVPQWERFAASLYDRREKIKIFVTGSSSKFLQKEISTLLSGRYLSETVFPLSFAELLNFKNISISKIAQPEIIHYFNEYLEFGGFPRVVLETDKDQKRQILKEYYNTIVEKDIIFRHKIKNERDVKEILLYLISNIGQTVSTYGIEKNLGIDAESARHYLNHFQEAFLLDFVDFFSYKVKRQIYNPKKVYAADNGLINAASFRVAANQGWLLENTIFQALKQKGGPVFYWKNKAEADFVVRRGYNIEAAYNVCWSLKDKQAIDREFTSLQIIEQELKPRQTKLIFHEKSKDITDKNLIKAIDFLLNESS